jgi:hypothetical protein
MIETLVVSSVRTPEIVRHQYAETALEAREPQCLHGCLVSIDHENATHAQSTTPRSAARRVPHLSGASESCREVWRNQPSRTWMADAPIRAEGPMVGFRRPTPPHAGTP